MNLCGIFPCAIRTRRPGDGRLADNAAALIQSRDVVVEIQFPVLFWSGSVLTPVECLTFEFQYRLYTRFPATEGSFMPGVSKPRYKRPFFRSGMNLSFTCSGKSRCPYGWFFASLSSVQSFSDNAFPLNNFLVCLVPFCFRSMTRWVDHPPPPEPSGKPNARSASSASSRGHGPEWCRDS